MELSNATSLSLPILSGVGVIIDKVFANKSVAHKSASITLQVRAGKFCGRRADGDVLKKHAYLPLREKKVFR